MIPPRRIPPRIIPPRRIPPRRIPTHGILPSGTFFAYITFPCDDALSSEVPAKSSSPSACSASCICAWHARPVQQHVKVLVAYDSKCREEFTTIKAQPRSWSKTYE